MSQYLDFLAEFGDPSINDITQTAKSEKISAYEKCLILSLAETTKFKELSRTYYRKLILMGTFTKQCIGKDIGLIERILLNSKAETPWVLLPNFSWSISFRFKLAKAYLSHDDANFYPIENPVRKDKAFKVPLISGGQWKGILRSTAVRSILLENSSNEKKFAEKFAKRRWQLLFLFGTEKDNMHKTLNEANPKAKDLFEERVSKRFGPFEQASNEFFQAGRLRFYPSFFDRVGLEVINPHDRKRKVGTLPIYMESIPKESVAQFKMTYTPFDLMGLPRSDMGNIAGDDLVLLAETLRDMFTVFGFGAKISSGFGLSEPLFPVDGEVCIKIEDIPEEPEIINRPQIPAELAEFQKNFPDETFELKGKEWRKKFGRSKKEMQSYMKARKAQMKFRREQARFEESSIQGEKEIRTVEQITRRPITGFDHLCSTASSLAASWRK